MDTECAAVQVHVTPFPAEIKLSDCSRGRKFGGKVLDYRKCKNQISIIGGPKGATSKILNYLSLTISHKRIS